MRRFIRKLRTMFRNFDQPVIFLDDRDGEFSVSFQGQDWSDVAAVYYGDEEMRNLGDIALFLNAHDNWATILDRLYDRDTGSALNLKQLIGDSEQLQKIRSNARFAQDV